MTVGKTGTGSGLITGPGILCGVDCTEPYNRTTPPPRHPDRRPAAGSALRRLERLYAPTHRTCAVTMSAAKTAARFNTTTPGTNALTLYKVAPGLGTVVSSPAGIDSAPTCAANFARGKIVILTATRAPDSIFAGWGGGGALRPELPGPARSR